MGKVYEFPARHAKTTIKNEAPPMPMRRETRVTNEHLKSHFQLMEHLKYAPCDTTWERLKALNEDLDECVAERELILEISHDAAVDGCYDGNWTEDMEREFQERMADRDRALRSPRDGGPSVGRTENQS